MDSNHRRSLMVSLELPHAVVEQIVVFTRQQKSGWIQLNFNSGRLESWQIHEHRRINS